MIVLGVAGVHHPYALLSLGLCAFVIVTVLMEFYKGANALRKKYNSNFLAATIELTHRNTRRYGGYLVHMGIVLMFIGFTGAAFNQDATVEVGIGQKFKIGKYEAVHPRDHRRRQQQLRMAPRRHRRLSQRPVPPDPRTGTPLLQGEQAADLRSRDPPPV